jgi:hypothetical protein
VAGVGVLPDLGQYAPFFEAHEPVPFALAELNEGVGVMQFQFALLVGFAGDDRRPCP